MSAAVDRVEILADEYRALVANGRVVEAGQVRRTIDDLGAVSGSYVDGSWKLHEWVLQRMGVQ